MKGSVQENSISPSKRTAKIHDFCFGIPFGEYCLKKVETSACLVPDITNPSFLCQGGLVFTGGIVGFIFSRNPATLSNGVLFGGALLAFSTISLRVWRQGKSSLQFILGQAALNFTTSHPQPPGYMNILSPWKHLLGGNNPCSEKEKERKEGNACCNPSMEKHADFLSGSSVYSESLLVDYSVACIFKLMIVVFLQTRKLFPTGFYAAMSAAMFCFYSYVVLSGGNPLPKKLKVSAAGTS
ncbi:hypothetical protein KY284_019809 [Solanum tuberosum]|nr:hypothetical protein KY284_019809 [Solanum tuberosum]